MESFAQSLPGKPGPPVRVSSAKVDATTASITLEWSPLIETGGVPLTGYKLYVVDDKDEIALVYDGTDEPAVTQT